MGIPSASWPAFCIASRLHFSYSSKYVVALHFGFKFCFLNEGNIFSCAYWSFCVVRIFINSRYKSLSDMHVIHIFFSVYGFLFYFLYTSFQREVLIKSDLSFLSFMFRALLYSKKFLRDPGSQIFSTAFSSRSFIVSSFTFISRIHFQ